VTTFTWAIANMEHYTSTGPCSLFTIHRCQRQRRHLQQRRYGSVGLEKPEPGNMIPYADLTEEIVVGWVKDHFGAEKVAEIEAALQAQIDQQHAPTTAPGVPWS
jgi:hypothetical protein